MSFSHLKLKKTETLSTESSGEGDLNIVVNFEWKP